MKYPKSTISKDGIKRFTITIRYRIGENYIKNALMDMAYEMEYDITDLIEPHLIEFLNNDFLPTLSKEKIFKRTKEIIENRGINWYFEGKWREKNYKAIENWAIEVIKKFFPELY